MILAIARPVLAERDVELPVQGVLDLPMSACGFEQNLGSELFRQYEKANILLFLATELARRHDAAERFESGKFVVRAEILRIETAALAANGARYAEGFKAFRFVDDEE